MVEIPRYETYSLLSLYQVLNSIRGDLYPEVYEALEKEIGRREPESITELEDCYFALDKNRHPGYEARLRRQIEELGGFRYASIEPITEENKYRTFWRRFWAAIFDAVILGIPLWIGAVVAELAGIVESALSPYVRQSMELVAVAYSVVMHARYGQTLGKMATGIKVLDVAESRDLNLRQALLRDIVPLLVAATSTAWLISFGAGDTVAEASGAAAVAQYAVGVVVPVWVIVEVVTMLFNRKRRAVHDFIAGTVVIRIAN